MASNELTFREALTKLTVLLLALVLLMLALQNASAQVYEKVFSFAGAAGTGTFPDAALLLASDGNYYGTTSFGGSSSDGTVFKVTPAGVLTTLYNFSGNDGQRPEAGLVQGGDGNFYGTTEEGGSSGDGTVFKITPAGALTTLVTFNGKNGGLPQGALIQGSDGNFYGTTQFAGSIGGGTVFEVTPAGALTTLVNFNNATTGSQSLAPLVQGSDGNLYGTTEYGGTANEGTFFKVTTSGVLTTLVTFNGTNGEMPCAGVVQGVDGNFYGTTEDGGSSNLGTVFKVTPAGVLTTLVNFNGTNGEFPVAGLLQGSDGNFYGTTPNSNTGSGTIFKVTPTGVITTLTNFGLGLPFAGLIQGSDGKFYGTTHAGGSFGFGSVFQVTPAGGVTTLVSFNINTNPTGENPMASLIQGSDGNFYGTTNQGGSTIQDGTSANFGTVFKLTPAGALTTLINFGYPLGENPVAGLVQDSNGNFYGTTFGTTQFGGTTGFGTIFQTTSTGVSSPLVNFNGTDGKAPQGGLVQGTDGNYYGTTSLGGSTFQQGVNDGDGTIFKVTPAGALTTLVNFTGTNGSNPLAGLVQGSDGNFYGTTGVGGSSSDGTVFKVTPAGVFTKLVDFTGPNGVSPLAGLIQGSDGNFYGTTQGGGSSGYGTVFKMTPAGVLTTLVNFNKTNGGFPAAAVVLGGDGNFYGTTAYGGIGASIGYGTVFQMTPGGTLTTLYDFANDPIDSNPDASLIQASDGNFYGTTYGGTGGYGCVYRLIMPGKPNIYPGNAVVQSSTSATVSLSANSRGSTTSVTLSYGTDGVTFPNIAPITVSLSGFTTTLLGTTLTNLSPGITYYYQITATNGNGTTVTQTQIFSTLAPPTAAVTAPSNILPTSAQFDGTVNAENYDATVMFQYSADSNFGTYQTATPLQSPVTGNSDTAVNVNVAGLSAGTTYYYRINAMNAGGTVVSGVSSFTTLTNPVETVLPASLVSSQSAQLNGTCNAEGAATAVTIEYGTDNANFPVSVGASPATVNGTTAMPVDVVISNSSSTPLTQGTTYYYRVRGTSAGGTSVSSSASFSLDVLSGFARQFPGTPPSAQGVVLATLTPSTITTGWRFLGEEIWRSSGVPALGLVTGNYAIEYRPASGYIQPPSEQVLVTSGGSATILSREYYPEAGGGPVGGLSILLQPEALADDSVPAATRAQWRFLGEDDTAWRDSGVTVSNLAPGNYLVECKPVSGETTPPPASVTVTSGTTIAPTLTYFIASTPVGAQPAVLSFGTVTNTATQNLPYAFVGQIRSDVGSSSGFVVKPRVVATAGHVVFDDGSLTYVNNLQWLFQRTAGTFEPVPQTPAGSYVFDGYATQRAKEATPGVSTVASQNLDAAAMYFLADAGNGGYGGYLGSNSTPNEFLSSARNKILVGYPVDGTYAAQAGNMFATPAVTAALSQVIGTDSSGDPETNGLPYQVYTTTSFTSAGGNSGGPLCVLFDDGNYYPAAIYLGGSSQTVVRAIDGAVIDLFDKAEISADTGQDQTGGGITLVNSGITGTSFGGAGIKVSFAPSGAMAAKWGLDGTTPNGNGNSQTGLGPGPYTLTVSTLPGFLPPSSPTVTAVAKEVVPYIFTYEGFTSQPQNVSAASGGSATFTVTASGTATAFQWMRNGSPIMNATSSSYTRSNLTTADNGSTYSVMVTWGSDGSLPSNAAVLSVGASSQLTFAQWESGFGISSGQIATPQNDGVSNLLKFVFDINPSRTMLTTDKAALPVLSMATVSSVQYLTLTYRQNPNMSGVTVNFQSSPDLKVWTTAAPPDLSRQVGTDATTGDPMMQIGVKATGTKQFIRLDVTSP